MITLSFFTDLFTESFMQRAFLAGIMLGVLAPLIGSIVIIRRLSFIADTLGHFSLVGISLSLFLSYSLGHEIFADKPLFLGIFFSVVGGLLIEAIPTVLQVLQGDLDADRDEPRDRRERDVLLALEEDRFALQLPLRLDSDGHRRHIVVIAVTMVVVIAALSSFPPDHLGQLRRRQREVPRHQSELLPAHLHHCPVGRRVDPPRGGRRPLDLLDDDHPGRRGDEGRMEFPLDDDHLDPLLRNSPSSSASGAPIPSTSPRARRSSP
ncbi:MAG: metal ABC transporter permease [Bacillus subtilis]|nr:metal ABC transporter permease [Bacillus subtilis]